MAYYLKGIGDTETGANEISPQFDAKINKFISVNDAFVVGSDADRFAVEVITRGVRIGPGMACAYGYYGLSDTTVQFNFVTPSSGTQYAKIYAEFNLATSPQSFSIKATPQSSTQVIDLTQDDLSENPTGLYQLELYLVTIPTSGLITVRDTRKVQTTIGRVENSNTTENAIYETDNKRYRPIKYDSVDGVTTTLTGVSKDEEIKMPVKSLVWRSPYWYGIGTLVPGNDCLFVEFNPQTLYGVGCGYEIVFDYSPSLPENLLKIPKAPGEDYWYSGGRMHIIVEPFQSPSGQPNILCYPLGTLINYSGHDDCGTGSALLICPSYVINGKRGLFFQYIQRVGNSNQAQNECRLIEIYELY